MISTSSKLAYRAFGLTIWSDIPLPELQAWTPADEREADLSIDTADLTEEWQQHAIPGRYFVVTEDFVMFMVPDNAIYYITGGSRILYSPLPGADSDQMRLYLLGSCMGAVLLQRKILPLHGSALVIEGKAYAIVGESGAGKSTLASALMSLGCPLLSDDVIPVKLSEDGIPVVTPSYPQQKLWQESLTSFGMDAQRYRPLFQRETKYAIPVADHFQDSPVPLAGVFELIKSDTGDVQLKPIQKLERLPVLYAHTYRNFMLDRMGLLEWHLRKTAAFSQQIDVFRLCRPADRFTATDLANLIIKTIQGGEVHDH